MSCDSRIVERREVLNPKSFSMVHGEDCGQAFRSRQQKQMAANRLHGSDHAHTGLGVTASGLEFGR